MKTSTSTFKGTSCAAIALLLALLLPAAALADTTYYVDPDYGGAGGAANGTAARPWTSLGSWGSSQWSAINTALAAGNVTVYFSCANAAGMANQTTTTPLSIARTAGVGAYRLTLDGNTYYNTSDAAPSAATWVANPGSYKFQVNASYPFDQSCAGGYGSCGTTNNQDKITIKGFWLYSTTAANAVYINGINNLIFTQNTTRGAFHIEYGNTAGANKDNGGLSGIEISYNDMSTQSLDGETLYLGSCGYGQTTHCHSNVSVHHNTVHDSRSGTGQQDGIDLKAGITNLTVYNNTVYNCAADGIVSLSGGSFYNNLVYGNGYGGLTVSSFWAPVPSVLIYNNVLYGNAGGDSRGAIHVKNEGNTVTTVKIYNNSSLHSATSPNIMVTSAANLYLKNNITSGTATQVSLSGVGAISGGYNDFFGTVSGYTRTTGDLNTDPKFKSTTDLTLQTSSPCIGAGTNLTAEGIQTDMLQTRRSATAAWNMGAYEWNPNLHIVQ